MGSRNFSEAGLARIRDGLKRGVEKGAFTGAICLIERGGEIETLAVGNTEVGGL